MDWASHAATWPMAEHSRFALCKPHHWHIQEMGSGSSLLLIHGAGGATHSWRHLVPLLAETHHVIAVDLPGQGFTRLGARQRCGIDDMAFDLQRLCDDQQWDIKGLIGHSAGAALALRMVEQRRQNAPPIIGINAALAPFEGVAGVLFPVLAKTLSMMPLVPDLFAASSNTPSAVQRLIAGTGSALDSEGLALYRALIADRGHVDATLRMMAQWRLDPLLARLAEHPSPVLLITGANDRTVKPSISSDASRRIASADHIDLPGLGHLAHEEDAQAVHAAMAPFLEVI